MSRYQKVFLIDDDELHNFLCESIIRSYKFSASVTSFLWAEEALQTLASLSQEDPASFPEIIFLDIHIPGMNGWEFIEEFKKLPGGLIQNCQLFVLSSAIDKQNPSPSPQQSVVTDYFSKPFSPDILNIISDMYLVR
ncbi:response regulator [Rufibacter quisquiliarum]|uniref:CheY-like chemotaxis protein n=1 Tax=Rufibacter quisquiliarum TaxID=1549639 RepID=A0A839GJF3_9BACT|nr:response regulator [Rufibacter quisquiliarum]MBA9078760.1 CheY-like chemotaxis protein [Rufibacter quisquiliarum]